MRRRGATGRAGHRGRRALALLACFGLGACAVPRFLNPAEIYREVSGANDAARPVPPGLDRPFPSLGSVPPRPDRPSPEARQAITDALAADRGRSREPVALRAAPGGGEAAAPAGMGAGPPPRPALAAAPRVPWTDGAQPPPAAPARGGGTPAAAPAPPTRPPAPQPPAVPDAAPAPPPPDLLEAPPPLPPPDLLAPPPPARR